MSDPRDALDAAVRAARTEASEAPPEGEAPPPPETADELVLRAQAGDAAAREELIERHLPLIRAVARDYGAPGIEHGDLVQEGCVGLLRALARFDPGHGTPFGAYATWWIRHALQELRSDFLRPLRLPPRALRQLGQLKSEHERVYQREHREPSSAELAASTGIDAGQAAALLRADAATRSLDEPVAGAEGEVGSLGELLDDPLSAQAYEDVLDGIVGAQLRELLGRLTDREREIVDARFRLAVRAGTTGCGAAAGCRTDAPAKPARPLWSASPSRRLRVRPAAREAGRDRRAARDQRRARAPARGARAREDSSRGGLNAGS